jgi:hypothetical protein
MSQSLRVLSQPSLTEKWGEEDRILRSIEGRLEVTSSPVVFGAQVDIVQGVHVDPYDLASREHVSHKVNQSAETSGKRLQVRLGDGAVETFFNDVTIEHIEVVPRATTDGDVVGLGNVGEQGVPKVGDPGLIVERTAGEAVLEVAKGCGVGGVREA